MKKKNTEKTHRIKRTISIAYPVVSGQSAAATAAVGRVQILFFPSVRGSTRDSHSQ